MYDSGTVYQLAIPTEVAASVADLRPATTQHWRGFGGFVENPNVCPIPTRAHPA